MIMLDDTEDAIRADKAWEKKGWYFTEEEVERSPSWNDNMSSDEEKQLRRKTHTLVFKFGSILNTNMLLLCSAMFMLHRTMCQVSFRRVDRVYTAAAGVFLASKIEEARLNLKDMVYAAYSIRFGNDARPSSREYEAFREGILKMEGVIINAVGFDFVFEHPYAHVKEFAQKMSTIGWLQPSESLTVIKDSIVLATCSLRGTMCVEYRPSFYSRLLVYFSVLKREYSPPPSHGTWARALQLEDSGNLNRACSELMEYLDGKDEENKRGITTKEMAPFLMRAGHIRQNGMPMPWAPNPRSHAQQLPRSSHGMESSGLIPDADSDDEDLSQRRGWGSNGGVADWRLSKPAAYSESNSTKMGSGWGGEGFGATQGGRSSAWTRSPPSSTKYMGYTSSDATTEAEKVKSKSSIAGRGDASDGGRSSGNRTGNETEMSMPAPTTHKPRPTPPKPRPPPPKPSSGTMPSALNKPRPPPPRPGVAVDASGGNKPRPPPPKPVNGITSSGVNKPRPPPPRPSSGTACNGVNKPRPPPPKPVGATATSGVIKPRPPPPKPVNGTAAIRVNKPCPPPPKPGQVGVSSSGLVGGVTGEGAKTDRGIPRPPQPRPPPPRLNTLLDGKGERNGVGESTSAQGNGNGSTTNYPPRPPPPRPPGTKRVLESGDARVCDATKRVGDAETSSIPLPPRARPPPPKPTGLKRSANGPEMVSDVGKRPRQDGKGFRSSSSGSVPRPMPRPPTSVSHPSEAGVSKHDTVHVNGRFAGDCSSNETGRDGNGVKLHGVDDGKEGVDRCSGVARHTSDGGGGRYADLSSPMRSGCGYEDRGVHMKRKRLGDEGNTHQGVLNSSHLPSRGEEESGYVKRKCGEDSAFKTVNHPLLTSTEEEEAEDGEIVLPPR